MIRSPLRMYLPWLIWAGVFLAVWLGVVLFNGWQDRVAESWPIALAMLVGSYVAGSTPMGGGTVGFPILVLLFQEPASFGRQFSFAIQSVGMVSASIFILCSRRRVAWRPLVWAAIGSGVSLVLARWMLTPIVPEDVIKLIFACTWGGFGIVTLVKLRDLLRQHAHGTLGPRIDAVLGLSAGLVGGVASALTGVGIDMVTYVVLVLVYRTDIRTAIATSVLLMSWNSLLGLGLELRMGGLPPEVVSSWLAAAPVVLFGAPIGAWAVSRIPVTPTLVFVSLLCVAQLVWTCVNVQPSALTLVWIGLAVGVMNGLFHGMHVAGARWHPVTPPGLAEG